MRGRPCCAGIGTAHARASRVRPNNPRHFFSPQGTPVTGPGSFSPHIIHIARSLPNRDCVHTPLPTLSAPSLSTLLHSWGAPDYTIISFSFNFLRVYVCHLFALSLFFWFLHNFSQFSLLSLLISYFSLSAPFSPHSSLSSFFILLIMMCLRCVYISILFLSSSHFYSLFLSPPLILLLMICYATPFSFLPFSSLLSVFLPFSF